MAAKNKKNCFKKSSGNGELFLHSFTPISNQKINKLKNENQKESKNFFFLSYWNQNQNHICIFFVYIYFIYALIHIRQLLLTKITIKNKKIKNALSTKILFFFCSIQGYFTSNAFILMAHSRSYLSPSSLLILL